MHRVRWQKIDARQRQLMAANLDECVLAVVGAAVGAAVGDDTDMIVDAGANEDDVEGAGAGAAKVAVLNEKEWRGIVAGLKKSDVTFFFLYEHERPRYASFLTGWRRGLMEGIGKSRDGFLDASRLWRLTKGR